MGETDEMKKFDFSLKIFEEVINRIYSGSQSDAEVLLAVIGELVINVVPQLYLKHRHHSYQDFCEQLENYLEKIKIEAIKEYNRLVEEEKF